MLAGLMRILIVEDNDKMRRMLKRTLSRALTADLQFMECEDGEQAVEMYGQFMPDWVLMDIQLQNQDGLLATQQIVTAHPDARVVIVTSYDEAEYRTAARNAGALDYVQKENLSSLIQIINAE
jgi:CheY-like chemotaxis protein